RFAQELAQRPGQPVLFVATAEAGDEEMRHRIEAHRRVRPTAWRTLETPNRVGQHILQEIGGAKVVIIDCVTLLVSNILNQFLDPAGESIDGARVEKAVIREIDELIDCLNRVAAIFIIVTNEVGMGLVPVNLVGRLYRDLLGKANQRLAERADEVYLMVSGLPVNIKP
ncbi:MAG TPA: bifunctional adenosylcobinamide kinase/adenosylcobinamide-phosphate guanylyltransferase, partial [Dehalococcoidales bacterium]